MATPVQITPLTRSGRDVMRFLRMSYTVYDRDPRWVAPLLMDLKKVFTDKNPLFQHAEMQLWVATRDRVDVGRVAAILHHGQRDEQGRPLGFFGFFECTEDQEVCSALFEQVYAWLRAKGVENLMGPVNPTTNDECGLLIDAFDSPPVFMMTYNPAYYARLLEAQGFLKAKDLLAYFFDLAVIPMDRLTRIAEKLKQRNSHVRLRPILRKTLKADLVKVKEVYNAAWQDNWGFIPMTDAEMDFMADRLKPLLMEGLVWLAESAEKPVGFLLATPDFNVPLKPLKGRLLTPKLVGFLPYLMGWKRPHRTRVLTLGVVDEFRGRGLESAMLIEGLKVGIQAGVTESEASWILEDNLAMRRVLESMGGRPYKTYRLYQKTLSG